MKSACARLRISLSHVRILKLDKENKATHTTCVKAQNRRQFYA